MILAHGIVEYKYTEEMLMNDLTFLNARGDCHVRVLHEVRTRKQYFLSCIDRFEHFCEKVSNIFPRIQWWCGRNLYDWTHDYFFGQAEPTCTEKYSSVCPPKYLDDWYPWLYARLNNEKILQQGTEDDIMLIDFVNIKEL